jgi:hypothetical protein
MLFLMNGATHIMQAAKGMVALAVLAVASACGAPATVEGVFASDTFRLESQSPLTKPTASGRDMVVVLSQADSETLRTVTLTLPKFADLTLGQAVDVGSGEFGDDRPSLEVAQGDLLVETRADGVELISSTNNVFANATSGTFTLDGRDADGTLAGSFSVDLDDGGFLQGSFVATPAGVR